MCAAQEFYDVLVASRPCPIAGRSAGSIPQGGVGAILEQLLNACPVTMGRRVVQRRGAERVRAFTLSPEAIIRVMCSICLVRAQWWSGPPRTAHTTAIITSPAMAGMLITAYPNISLGGQASAMK